MWSSWGKVERVETTFGVLVIALALMTVLWSDWIEAVFRVDPDHGDGSVEWLVVAALATSGSSLLALARRERRRRLAGTV